MKKYLQIVFILLMIGVLAIFGLTTLNKESMFGSKSKQQSNVLKADPQETVESFYSWYLEYEGNPLSSGAYKMSEELSPTLVEKIDQELDNMDKGGADPIICAQDKPDNLSTSLIDVRETKARVSVKLKFPSMEKQIEVELIQENDQWLINEIVCKGEVKKAPASEVVIYFNNPNNIPDEPTECGFVYGVERNAITAADQEQRLSLVLNELFQGPTAAEQELGFISIFSQETEDALISVNIQRDTAFINLADIRNIIPGANSSCSSKDFYNQIEETVKHNTGISEVAFAINGDPELFYNWMQQGCPNEEFCDSQNFK